jgi:phasin family protein
MNTEMYDQWLKMSKAAVEPMMRLNEITAHAMERVARQQLDLAREYVELGARQMQLMGGSTDPKAIMAEEGKLVAEFGDKLRERAQEYVQIATETQQAVSAWAEKAAEKATTQAQA